MAAIGIVSAAASSAAFSKSADPRNAARRASVTASAAVATVPVKRPFSSVDTRLVLEDGSIWRGRSFGATGTQIGEVVFNTSLTGYQEILTDPSYAGQFVLMTVPHIGNTGINTEDEESSECFLGALVVRDLSKTVSNWRSTESLSEYLRKRNVMGITDLDTRAITRRLREDGSLVGVLTTDSSKLDVELLDMARAWNIEGKDLISGVSCTEPYQWKDKTGSEWEFSKEAHAASETFNVRIRHHVQSSSGLLNNCAKVF